MELKIDYSRIPQSEVVSKTTYRPPRSVYFGKRGEDGMMEERPEYKHQEYPRMVYKKEKSTIVAEMCHTDSEMTQFLNTGWVKNLAELGYLSAPSLEEHLKMKGIGQVTDKADSDPVTAPGEKKWRDMNAQERADFQTKKQAQAA